MPSPHCKVKTPSLTFGEKHHLVFQMSEDLSKPTSVDHTISDVVDGGESTDTDPMQVDSAPTTPSPPPLQKPRMRPPRLATFPVQIDPTSNPWPDEEIKKLLLNSNIRFHIARYMAKHPETSRLDGMGMGSMQVELESVGKGKRAERGPLRPKVIMEHSNLVSILFIQNSEALSDNSQSQPHQNHNLTQNPSIKDGQSDSDTTSSPASARTQVPDARHKPALPTQGTKGQANSSDTDMDVSPVKKPTVATSPGGGTWRYGNDSGQWRDGSSDNDFITRGQQSGHYRPSPPSRGLPPRIVSLNPETVRRAKSTTSPEASTSGAPARRFQPQKMSDHDLEMMAQHCRNELLACNWIMTHSKTGLDEQVREKLDLIACLS
jgi:hypothetical protein